MSKAETTGELAINGGPPVRDVNRAPWPVWPLRSEREWSQRIEPALRAVYMSGVEGLPEPQCKAFARRLAEYCGARYGRMLVHGTDAIAAALSATLDLDAWGDGGEVILPDYTFIASASATLDRRCTLAFVDIDPHTFTIDPVAIEQAIRPGRTRAIMPVHLGGHPADMDAINDIATRHGLVVLEDCAQAHGAEYKGRRVGSIGHAGAFSFQSSKNLTAGEGGAVTTNDPEVDARVAAFMDVGRHPTGERWEYPRLGWNYRPSEYLAALLSVRLDDLEAQTQHRARMAAYLSGQLEGIPGLTPPRTAEWCTRHAYHLYSMLIDPRHFGGQPRRRIVEAVCAEGVPCLEGYTTPLSEQPALRHLREKYPQTIRVLPSPNVADVSARSVWLVQQMLLAEEPDMDDVARAFRKVQKAFSAAG
jgi:dTDP-4-amino-4,6-dideoxygalactose transaminase